MQKFVRVDADGFFLEDVLFKDNVIPADVDIILVAVPEGFYLPRWDFVNQVWVEGKSQAEILESKKTEKITELNGACNTTILAGYSSSASGVEYAYAFDYEAQINLAGAKQLFNDNPTTTIEWSTEGSGPVTLDSTQFNQLWMDGFIHKNSNIQKYRTLKAQVEAAATIAEVEAVVW